MWRRMDTTARLFWVSWASVFYNKVVLSRHRVEGSFRTPSGTSVPAITRRSLDVPMFVISHLLCKWETSKHGVIPIDQVTFSAADVANPPQVGRKCGDRSGPDIQYAWYDGSCNEIQKDMRLSNRNAQFIGPILWPL
ncbi:hypothetical protein EDB85DRAFT_1035190 [Lactarius pseudohatsudake]|nr:hypothetical protein EDB85DRAFT_1035190 [Lactarius pseudohatsudake]